MANCGPKRQVCLNVKKDENHLMTKKCKIKGDEKPDEGYNPLVALTHILEYTNTDKFDEVDEIEGHDQMCYLNDLTWVVVIKDIGKRIDLLKRVDFKNALADPKIKKEMITEIKKTGETPLDVKALFLQIIEVGKKKWMLSGECKGDEKDCIGYTYINKLAELVNSPSFGRFSTKVLEMIDEPERVIEQMNAASEAEPSEAEPSEAASEAASEAEPSEAELNEFIMEQIKNLFSSTIVIMNPTAADLTNTEGNFEKINDKFAMLQKLFDDIYKVSGGGKKTKRKRKNLKRKTQKRRNYKGGWLSSQDLKLNTIWDNLTNNWKKGGILKKIEYTIPIIFLFIASILDIFTDRTRFFQKGLILPYTLATPTRDDEAETRAREAEQHRRQVEINNNPNW